MAPNCRVVITMSPPVRGSGRGFGRGGIGGFGRGVRGALEAQVDDDVHHDTLAVSDSLVVFGLVRTAVRRGAGLADAVMDALTRVAAAARGAGEDATLNVVVADGRTLVATRCSVGLAGNSLHTLALADGWRVASEPLDPDDDWVPVPDDTVLVAGLDGVDQLAFTP